MKSIRTVCLIVPLFTAVTAFAQWKPVPGSLMTRWAADVKPESVLAEYPRPQLERTEWKNLNGLWDWREGTPDTPPKLGEALAEKILVPFPFESALSGVKKNVRSAWYRRTFEVPADWRARRTILNFGAVDWSCAVYINGSKVGEHTGGYDPFSFDITDGLAKGTTQEIWVFFTDPTDEGTQPRGKQILKPDGIWYTPCSGIWQTVWIEPVDSVHLTRVSIIPNLEKRTIRVKPEVSKTVPRLRVGMTVRTGTTYLARALLPVGVESEIGIPDVHPWSPEDPFLYEVDFDVGIGEGAAAKTFDRSTGYFGMRSISIGKDDRGVSRIMLNGRPYFHVGPLDQGFWPDGIYTAPTDEALRYDIEITKKLGFNAARKHVKVEPDRWYYWADKLGLLVWQDMPSGDRYIGPNDPDIVRTPESAAEYQKELAAIVNSRLNHPSIVMWVPFNEGWGQFDVPRIVEYVKSLDGSRLVDCASGWADRAVGDVHDIHVYPGPDSPEPESARAAVLGEFGGLGLRVEGHSWTDKNWGYRGTADKEDLTSQYVNLLRGVYQLADHPGLSAAIYTQTTDVETECNGLLTYDRAVIKVDETAVRNANRGIFPRIRTVDPAGDAQARWKYTTIKPANGWERPGFAASDWKEGQAGFGSHGTPGAQIGTDWTSPEIWVRREFAVGEVPVENLRLSIHHDEDCEVFINGVLAASLNGYSSSYNTVKIGKEALAAVKPAGNLLAVHCKQTKGGQFIDVKVIEERPVK